MHTVYCLTTYLAGIVGFNERPPGWHNAVLLLSNTALPVSVLPHTVIKYSVRISNAIDQGFLSESREGRRGFSNRLWH